MEPEWILRIVLFGIVHWILAGILLPDLVSRDKVFGGRKDFSGFGLMSSS
ncbi:unnamed protein product [marine sediment metagenome]|uniref:Uncharacterized protein n=1 Tax=marine sediment metagenome TaxID=412755 RepID=X1RHU4_9ZZZZ